MRPWRGGRESSAQSGRTSVCSLDLRTPWIRPKELGGGTYRCGRIRPSGSHRRTGPLDAKVGGLTVHSWAGRPTPFLMCAAASDFSVGRSGDYVALADNPEPVHPLLPPDELGLQCSLSSLGGRRAIESRNRGLLARYRRHKRRGSRIKRKSHSRPDRCIHRGAWNASPA